VAGNKASDSHSDKLDTTATITITNDGSGGDHIFNQNEAGAVNVSGTTTGVEAGRPVYVTFTDGTNSESSIVYVQKDGSWNTSGLTLDLTSLEQGKISVTASVVDKAGNTASDSVNNDVLDTVAPTLTIGTLAGDDIINAKEHTQSLTISGTTSRRWPESGRGAQRHALQCQCEWRQLEHGGIRGRCGQAGRRQELHRDSRCA
jgi:hypothetical protein